MKYLAFVDTPAHREQRRNVVPAGADKVAYVADALRAATGEPVELISPAWTRRAWAWFRGGVTRRDNGDTVRLFSTFGLPGPAGRVLTRWWARWCLVWYLLRHVQRGETVLAYHSPFFCRPLRLARAFKRFRLVLEVEEVYADIRGGQRQRRKEYRLFAAADAYLFPTTLLQKAMPDPAKPCAIVHGTYRAEPDRGVRFDDDKIHVVYAGTFEPRKGGAAAATAAAFLDERYHVHILGFGTPDDTDTVRHAVEETAARAQAAVTFDGLLRGEEYIRFLQCCHIGLSTQNPDAAYNATSFPSKVLSYLANGLRVVSIRIPAVEGSAVGGMLTYYDQQTPQQIAAAIQAVDMSASYDSRRLLEVLDQRCIEDLRVLVET